MSTDWIPCELLDAGPRRLVRWIHPGAGPLFQEPFFGQSMDSLVAAHLPQKLTPAGELAGVPCIRAPQGFIFHVSRCGSTLVSRSLAAVPRLRIISEAGPVNQLLLEQGDPAWLKGMLNALCGAAPGRPCIFKFTSWNLLFIEQLLALFPATPWVFVYRAPADVVHSLRARPPRWHGNPALADDLLTLLERMYAAPLAHLGPRAKVVNYAEMPGAIEQIAAHFGLEPDGDELAAMSAMARYDAKQPGKAAFQARAPAPQQAFPALDKLYAQLEGLRI